MTLLRNDFRVRAVLLAALVPMPLTACGAHVESPPGLLTATSTIAPTAPARVRTGPATAMVQTPSPATTGAVTVGRTVPVGAVTPSPSDGAVTAGIPSPVAPQPSPTEWGHEGPTTPLTPDDTIGFDIETFAFVASRPAATVGSSTSATNPPLNLTLPAGTLTSSEVHGPASYAVAFRPSSGRTAAWAELAVQLRAMGFRAGGSDVPTNLPATRRVQVTKSGAGRVLRVDVDTSGEAVLFSAVVS